MVENEILKKIGELSLLINEDSDNVQHLVERAKLYMKIERRDLALNDLNSAIIIDSEHIEANSFIMLLTSIDEYFYNQTYNV